MRAVIYERISDDRAGLGLGVARQDTDCRARCVTEGWEVADVLVDNDRSAYSGRRRPGYEALLEGLKEQRWDVIVAWHPDRLHRSPKELEQFIDVVEASGVRVVTIMAGAWDLSTASGRMTARVVGAVARHESEQKSERIRRKHRELAEAGKPSGNRRGYGFERDRVTHVPAEVAVLRQAAVDLLDGVTLRGIVLRLNEQGVPTADGGPWSTFRLRRLLTSERIGGYRIYGGKLHPATWEPVLDDAVWRRVRALLLDPTRRVNQSPRLYLLTGGLARCGLCDAALVARPKAGGRRCYVCASGPGFHGCGGIRILAEAFEADVLGQVHTQIEQDDLPDPDAEGPIQALIAEIDAAEASRAGLAADYYVHRTIDRDQFQAASAGLAAHLGGLRTQVGLAERRRHVPSKDAALNLLAGEDLLAKRPILDAYIERVVVSPAVKGRNYYEPCRVSVIWRA